MKQGQFEKLDQYSYDKYGIWLNWVAYVYALNVWASLIGDYEWRIYLCFCKEHPFLARVAKMWANNEYNL